MFVCDLKPKVTSLKCMFCLTLTNQQNKHIPLLFPSGPVALCFRLYADVVNVFLCKYDYQGAPETSCKHNIDFYVDRVNLLAHSWLWQD